MKKFYDRKIISDSIRHTIFIVCFLMITIPASATHIVGGALTYVYNGGSSYTVTLKLYRDCGTGSAAFPGTVTINVRGYNGYTFIPSKDFNMTLGTVTSLPSNLDTCAEAPSPIPCVQEGIYTTTVSNLPPGPGGYHMYYQVCCRNLTTTNVNCSCNCIGESIYAYIPGYTPAWFEDFTLANGTTIDAGSTAWTRTLGATPPTTASVNNNMFEVTGANNGVVTWSSQVINIAPYTNGVILSTIFSEAGNMDANDSLRIRYSLNGGPQIVFPTNGILVDDFTNATASTGVLTGNTIQIFIRARYDNNSPNSEIFRWDNVTVAQNDFVSNSNPVFTLFPPLFLCEGNTFTFDHSATDPNGDSLAYSFYSPYTDAAPTFPSNTATFTAVTFEPGYSFTDPLGGASLSLNPTTGILTGTPPTLGQFIVGIKVKEYRNGILLSEVIRDFQFNVINCPPPAQALIVPGDNIDVCSGNSLTFPNNSDAIADNWWWNFGDGTTTADTSIQEFPSYSYAGPGSYIATLIINKGTSCADTSSATVDVGFVNPSFTHNAPQCAGSSVIFTNTTTSSPNAGALTYNWDFGDSQTSSLASPTHTYTTGGTYNVRLIVSSALGCSDTVITAITINATPATPVPSSSSPDCVGQPINLSTTAVAGATYSWTGPSGFTSALQNPSIASATAANAGTYNLTVTVSGCTSAAGSTVVVVNPTPATPTATNNGPLCVGTTLNLSANTVAGATYSWTGPNGFTSALEDPSITNVTSVNAGVYSVTVTVGGCTSTAATTSVTISPAPAAPVAGNNGPVCAGATLNLTANTIAGATYNWTGPNGFTSSLEDPSITNVTSANAGVYSVTVTVAGCTGPAGSTTATVNPVPATPTAGSNSPVCAGQTINLTSNTIAGATYSWTGPGGYTSALEDPTRPNATVAMAGTYSLTVTVSGCTSSASTTSVTVNATPATPTAGNNGPLCAGSTLNLTANTVAGASYSWTGPSGFTSSSEDPSLANVQSTNAGTYSVTVTVGGCTSAAGTTTLTVNPIPAAPTAGSNSPVCAGSSINLTASSIAGATYSWTGPNTYTSSTQNPTISNSNTSMSGTYSVTATVAGCTGPAGTVSVTVNPIPSAPTVSSNSPVCAGSTINLSANTVAGATYAWTGPNGFTSSLEDPSVTNAQSTNAGTYSATVTVLGCTSAAATTTVTVNAIPATPTAANNGPVCEGATLNLTANTVAGATYSWTGPNGFTSSLEDPSITNVTSANAGTYSVTVTVSGCTSAAGTTTVTINPVPSAPTISSNSPVCTGQTITLTSNTVAGATYAWTGPSGYTSSLEDPTRPNATAAMAGNYSLTVTVGGCTSASSTTAVTINATPAVPTAGNNGPLCAGSTLNLTANTVAGATYSWTGPSGFTSSSEDPTLANAQSTNAGTYSVTVTANGCTSNPGNTSVTVNAIPAAPTAGSNSPVCAGNTINLTANTIAGATYSWTGPNGFTSSLQNPSISNSTTAMSGTYSVTVTVAGCTGSAGTVSVTVNPIPSSPTASSDSPVCVGEDLNLSASTIAGATYSWTGPGGFTSSSEDPTITNVASTNAGTYSVTVTVLGCTSSAATTSVTVNPLPAAPTAGSNSPLCEGQTLNLTASNIAGATYSWTGPSGFTSSLQNPSIINTVIGNSGIYSVTATVLGCTGPAGTVSVTINSTPIAPSAGSNSPVCSSDTIELSSTTVAGATYSWTGPNGFTSTLQNPIIINATTIMSGTYTVTVNNGCNSAPASTVVTVNTTPVAPTVSSNSPVCEGSTINLTANTVAGATYAWTGPNGFSSSLEDPSVTNALPANAGVYSVTTTVNGCTGPAGNVTVAVQSTPVADAGADAIVCANNNTVTLSGTSVTGSGQWTTSGNGTFGASASLNTTYTPGSNDITNGTVTLTLTTTNNGPCPSDNDAMTVTITPAPTASAGADQTVCANDPEVTLSGSFTVSTGAVWTTTGSGTFSPSITSMNVTYTPSATDISNGSVTITLTTTGNGDCIPVSDPMTVTITPAPVVNAGPDDSTCINNPNATLTGTSTTGSGTWTTSGTGTFGNANALNTAYTPSASDLSSGSVVITLTSTNNGSCIAVSDDMTLVFTQPPTVNAGSDETVCANNANVVLAGTSTTTSGAWTTSGSGTFTPDANTLNATYSPSATDTANGTVNLTLTSTNNGGCLAVTDQMTITITPAPTSNAGSDASVCANNANVNLSGSFTVSTGAQWSTSGSGTFSPNDVSMNTTYIPSASDTTSGSVTIYLTTTGNGQCTAVVDSMIITITNAPNVNAGPDEFSCLSSPNTSLSGTSGTGSGTWTTLGTGTFTPNANVMNPTYVPSNADTTAGNVTIIFTSTNNGGCNSSSDTMQIFFTPVPAVNAGADQTVCANNAAVSLNGSSSSGSGIWTSNGSGTFTPNATTLSATYTPSAADTTNGTVTLTLTATNACVSTTDNLTVTITNAPFVIAGSDISACSNNPDVSLSGDVGGATGTGVWSTSGDGTFNPSSADLNATYMAGTLDTSNGSAILILTSTGNGTCLAVTDTLMIIYTDPPVANAGNDLIGCANNSIQLSGTITAGNGTGIWSTPDGAGTFSSATNLNASYTPVNADTLNSPIMAILTSTNNGGCIADADTVLITVNPGPQVSAGADQTICSNNPSVTLNGSMVNSGGIKWTTSGNGTFSPDDISISTTYNPDTSEISNGSVTIYITSTGNGSCAPVTDSMLITFTPSPLVNAGAPIFICEGDMTAQLNGSITGATISGIWTTSGSGTFTPSDTDTSAIYNLSVADTTAGSVVLYLTSTNNGNCLSEMDSVTVTITTIPTVEAGNDTTVCANASASLNGIITGGSGTGVWTTNGDGTFAPDSATLNATYQLGPNDILNGTTVLTLTATQTCQVVEDSLVLTHTPAPNANAGGNQTICQGELVNLSGSVTNATGGQWFTSGDGFFVPSDTLLNGVYLPGTNDETSGTVNLSLITTGNGSCAADTNTMTVSIDTKPVAQFIHGSSCENAAVQFTDTSFTTNGTINSWNWTINGDTTSLENPGYTFTTAGTYNVQLIVATGGGCADTTQATITVNPTPQVSFTVVTECPDSATFTATANMNIANWSWNFGDSTSSNLQNPTHTYPSEGIYFATVTATTDSGCVANFTDTVTIDSCDVDDIFGPVAPTAFTPNGDGSNDVFLIRGGPFLEFELRIFNEWGNEIFKSTDQNEGWDGSYKNKKQPLGPYVWTYRIVTVDQEELIKSGEVTILK